MFDYTKMIRGCEVRTGVCLNENEIMSFIYYGSQPELRWVAETTRIPSESFVFDELYAQHMLRVTERAEALTKEYGGYYEFPQFPTEDDLS